ncbi:putative DNA excision repair protein Rad16 [Thermoascus aurantiacus ATCC 26904]
MARRGSLAKKAEPSASMTSPVQSKRTSSASSSRARRASSKVTHPALIGVDLEHTDDEDETDQSYAAGVRRGYREGRAALEAQARTSSIEIHIPVKKESPAQGPSSSTSVDGASRDEMNGDDTPATSVAVTPADSETNKPRKRVSASARARELRSSAFSLSTARGLKRDASVLSADDSTIESSDAALARALQMEEYQRTGVKRQKLSMGRSKPALEIQNSTDDDDMLTDLGSPPRHKAGDSLGAGNEAVIADSEDSALSDLDDLADRIGEQVESEMEDLYQPDSEQSDGESSVPQDGVPVGPRRRRATITGRSRALPDFEVLQQSSTTRVSRAVRERRKLEEQHPCIKTMWDDLKKTPPITPVAAEQPPGITRKLKSYQLEGLNWMMQQEKTQYRGGLLGDEMGMGKTIQAVSLIMSDYPVGKPSLVVVPPVALMQWQSEIKEYTDGKLKVLIYHNSNPKVKLLKKKDLLAYDVIMISYSGLESIYRKEVKGWVRDDGIVKEDSIIHSIHYHRLILDEAHSIKQRTTSVARACFALKAKYKWCLSGTPVQNRIGEFFSLLRFLQVRPFAYYFCKMCSCRELHWSQDKEKRCSRCGHSGFNHVSIFNQEILNPITERHSTRRKEALAKLRLITDRIMLRRVKREHTAAMELPPKRVIIHNEFFADIERDFSRSIMTNSTRQFDTYVSRGVMLNNYANIFGLIMQMRQVANHPDLILKKNAEAGQNVLVCSICDEPAEEAIRSRCHHEFCRQCAKDYIRSFDADTVVDCPRCHIPLSIDLEQPEIEQEEDNVKKNSIINRIRMEDWTSSTKIEMLVYDLYKLRSKKQTHKSIVFSQFTSMLQLVEWRLRRAGFNTVMLDGSMTPAQRQKSIEYFMNNVDVEVFLVSLKAGGVALNLTEASRVFIVDPWWNPAAEWQSADRCHRIGQRRPCVITRLCIEDSVESRIVLLQEKKANMINGTINKDQGEALEKLTPEDMQFLFRGS